MDNQRQQPQPPPPPPYQQQQDPNGSTTYPGPVADDDVNDNFNNILLKAKQIASRLAQDRAAGAYVNPLPQVDQARPAVPSGPNFNSAETSDVPLSGDPSLLRSGPTTSYAAGGRDSSTWQRSQSPRGRSRSPQRGPAHDDKRRYDRRSPPGSYRQPNEGAPANLPYDYPANSTHEQGSFNPDDSNVITMSFCVPNNTAGFIIGRGGENLKSIVRKSGARVQLQAQTDSEEDRFVTLTGVRSAIDKARAIIDQIILDAKKNNRIGDHPVHNPRNSQPPNGPPYYPAGAPPSSDIPPMGGLRPQQPPQKVSSLVPPREHATEDYNPVAGEMIIHVPNNKVGVIIGRGGDMIRDLQERSGARIAVTPDSEVADRSCEKRMVRLFGTLVNCRRAKSLIEDLVVALPQSRTNPTDPAQRFDPAPPRTYSAPSAVSLVLPPRPITHSFTELIYIPAETAGLVIGRGGETVRCLENASGAKITMENGEVVNGKRPVKVIGTADQIAHAKDLIIRKVEEDNFGTNKPRPVAPPDHIMPVERGYLHQSPAIPTRQEYARLDGAGAYGVPELRNPYQPTSEREQHLQQYSTPYDHRSVPPPAVPPYNPVPPYRDAYGAPSHGTSVVPPRAGQPVSSSVPSYNGGGYVPQGAPVYRQQPSYGTGVVQNMNAPMSGGSSGMMGYGSRHAHDDPYRRDEKRGEYDRDVGYSPYDGGVMHQQPHHHHQPQQQQQPPPPHQHVASMSSAPYGHPDSHLPPASGMPPASSDYASYYSRWYASQNQDGRNGGSAGAGGPQYGGRPAGKNRGGMY